MVKSRKAHKVKKTVYLKKEAHSALLVAAYEQDKTIGAYLSELVLEDQRKRQEKSQNETDKMRRSERQND
jgi:hypothetical protein